MSIRHFIRGALPVAIATLGIVGCAEGPSIPKAPTVCERISGVWRGTFSLYGWPSVSDSVIVSQTECSFHFQGADGLFVEGYLDGSRGPIGVKFIGRIGSRRLPCTGGGGLEVETREGVALIKGRYSGSPLPNGSQECAIFGGSFELHR